MKLLLLFLASGAGGAVLLEAFKRLIDYIVSRRARTDNMITNAVKSTAEVQVAMIEQGGEQWRSIWQEYLRQSTRAENAERAQVIAEAQASNLSVDLRESQSQVEILKKSLEELQTKLDLAKEAISQNEKLKEQVTYLQGQLTIERQLNTERNR